MEASGAEAEFDQLYDRCFAQVYAYAVTRVGRDLAEEVASETFTVAWRRRDIRPEVPIAWLLGIARNITRSRYRAELRQRAVAQELHAWAVDGQQGDDVAEVVTERYKILEGLALLSEADREALMLVAWHGLSSAEAATVVGCGRTAFSMRLHRARRHLERILSDGLPTTRDEPTQESRRS